MEKKHLQHSSASQGAPEESSILAWNQQLCPKIGYPAIPKIQWFIKAYRHGSSSKLPVTWEYYPTNDTQALHGVLGRTLRSESAASWWRFGSLMAYAVQSLGPWVFVKIGCPMIPKKIPKTGCWILIYVNIHSCYSCFWIEIWDVGIPFPDLHWSRPLVVPFACCWKQPHPPWPQHFSSA